MMIMIRCAEHHPEGEALGAARIHSLGRKIMKKTTKLSCGKCSGFRGLLLAAALGAGVGLLSFLPFLLRSRGQYLDGGDYYAQYVPFLLELKRMISSGSLAWSWNSFLATASLPPIPTIPHSIPLPGLPPCSPNPVCCTAPPSSHC